MVRGARELIGQAVAFDLRVLRRRRLVAERVVDPVLRAVDTRPRAPCAGSRALPRRTASGRCRGSGSRADPCAPALLASPATAGTKRTSRRRPPAPLLGGRRKRPQETAAWSPENFSQPFSKPIRAKNICWPHNDPRGRAAMRYLACPADALPLARRRRRYVGEAKAPPRRTSTWTVGQCQRAGVRRCQAR
jgi:hypothetical protein